MALYAKIAIIPVFHTAIPAFFGPSPLFPPVFSALKAMAHFSMFVSSESVKSPYFVNKYEKYEYFCDFFSDLFGWCPKKPYLCIRFRERNTSGSAEERVL